MPQRVSRKLEVGAGEDDVISSFRCFLDDALAVMQSVRVWSMSVLAWNSRAVALILVWEPTVIPYVEVYLRVPQQALGTRDRAA